MIDLNSNSSLIFGGYGECQYIRNEGPANIVWSKNAKIFTAEYKEPTLVMSFDGLKKAIGDRFPYTVDKSYLDMNFERVNRSAQAWPKILEHYIKYGNFAGHPDLRRDVSYNEMTKYYKNGRDSLSSMFQAADILRNNHVKKNFTSNSLVVLEHLEKNKEFSNPFREVSPSSVTVTYKKDENLITENVGGNPVIPIPATVKSPKSTIPFDLSKIRRSDGEIRAVETAIVGEPLEAYVDTIDRVKLSSSYRDSYKSFRYHTNLGDTSLTVILGLTGGLISGLYLNSAMTGISLGLASSLMGFFRVGVNVATDPDYSFKGTGRMGVLTKGKESL